jgi:hypothetical protein
MGFEWSARMDIARGIVLTITLALLFGCNGAENRLSRSRSHQTNNGGQAAPQPIRVDNAPPNAPEPAEILAIETPLTPRLPELINAYRLTLIEKMHHASSEVAEQYADVEIASLKTKFVGQDDALSRELGRRLRDAQPHYGAPAPAAGIKPVYPAEPGGPR